MIDIHSHILPGLDDGAKTEADSLEMARIYRKIGFEKIVATPHIMKKSGYQPTSFEIDEKINELNQKIQEEGIGIEVFPGAEYYVEGSFISLAEQLWPMKRINHTCYILVEMPALFVNHNLGLSFFNPNVKNQELRKELPFLRLILAHPERNEEVIKRPEAYIQRFKEQGMYIQMNLTSILGYYGKAVKKAAEIMLKTKMVDIIATDAHSPDQLISTIPQALERLEKLAGKKAIDVLLKINPFKIFSGETLEPFY